MTGRGTRARWIAALAALGLAATAGATAPSAVAAPSGWLHTEGSRIVTAGGDPYTIRGISWFGMETDNCAPHGLWSIPLDEGLAHIAALGFTTVRLPFSSQCLAASATTSINAEANPGLVGLAPLELMDAVVRGAASHGLTVILDRHRPGSAAQSDLWYTAEYGEERWIDEWMMLAARYRADPTVIGVDLHNEPHGPACWGCGDPATDWRAAATRAGDAVLSVNPNLLIIVEGVERQPDGTSTWWGGGLQGVAEHPVTLSVPNRVVYSPHDYPASVYAQPWFSAPEYPANLEALWDKNWGYLQREDIAPVLVGEFGTRLATESDRAWMQTLVAYLAKTGMSFAYWSFNPNSGDTGGLVADDWRTPETAKLEVLAPLLTPGAATPPSAMPSPSLSPTPTASPTPRPPPTPTPSPRPPLASTPSPTPTPSPRRPKPSPTPAAPSSPATTAEWALQSSWADGYVAEIVVTSAEATPGWSVSFVSPGATAIVNSWGMDCALADETITCSGSGWAASPAAGGSVRVGLQVAAATAPRSPSLMVAPS